MAAAIHRHSDAIGYDAFRARAAAGGVGRGAPAGRRSGDRGLPARADLAGRVGFGEHAASLRRARVDRICERRSPRGRGAPAQHWPPPRRPKRRWPRPMRRPARPHRCGARRCAHRRAGTARSSSGRRPAAARGARDLFAALADSPPTAALLRLAELATPAATPPRRTSCASAPPRAHLSWQNRHRGWQSVGIGGPEPSRCHTTRTGGSN